MHIDFPSALSVTSANKIARAFPGRADSRFQEGSLFPAIRPKFTLNLDQDETVFTIGSCFARNMEEALESFRVLLPTRLFAVPKSEYAHRANGLLNEYSPGTISQRIMLAIEGRSLPEATIVPTESGFADLALHGGADVSLDRALQRREEIDAIYKQLKQASFVIITLGYIEAWFDRDCGVYLNRMPPPFFANRHPERFEFRQMDVADCYSLLEKALGVLCDLGVKVILTVSPVPIQMTFMPADCVTANEFSKSVLRICAEKLEKKFASVDYFPSYEIVRSGGLSNFIDDNVHVKDEVVRRVMTHMIKHYRNLPPVTSDRRLTT